MRKERKQEVGVLNLRILAKVELRKQNIKKTRETIEFKVRVFNLRAPAEICLLIY
jgi:hypothetical protein